MTPIPTMVWALGLVLALSACSLLPSPTDRYERADQLASSKGWHHEQWKAGAFQVALWTPDLNTSPERLSIYIEGDGLAWVSPSSPSDDPTPIDPIALRLALAQPSGRAVYLARPCQYVDAEHTACSSAYWTSRRFSDDVVRATDEAVSRLKRASGAEHLTLVGYSGGGAIAALVAARRNDIDRLVTVAGNLDPRAWAEQQGLRPLDGSLDPVDDVRQLTGISQWHFVGGRDTVVPAALTRSFADRFPPAQRPAVIPIDEFGHACCWADRWPALWTTYLAQPSVASGKAP